MSFQPVIPEGTHLGESQNNPGAYSGLVFDDESGELKGHASWVWVEDVEDDDDYSSTSGGHDSPGGPGSTTAPDSAARPLTEEEMEIAIQLVTLLAIGVAEATIRLAPHLKRFWISTVVPTSINVLNKLKALIRSKPAADVDGEYETLVDDPLDDSSPTSRPTEIVVFEEPFTLTESEWRRRYDAMIAAARFSEEQRLILNNAAIVSAQPGGELSMGTKALTAREFAQRILPTIAANPELLTPETLQTLAASTNMPPRRIPKILVRRGRR